jgi:hypothetical protein
MDRSTLSQIIIPVVILILFVIGIYGVVRLRNNIGNNNPPTLSVNVEENSKTTNDKLVLSGTTSAQDITVNGNKVDVDKEGNFSYQVPLNPGENKITATATANGKTTTLERTIVREGTVAATPPPGGAQGLTESGPAENIGIVGLTGLIIAGYYYLRSRSRHQHQKVSYKLFTKS